MTYADYIKAETEAKFNVFSAEEVDLGDLQPRKRKRPQLVEPQPETQLKPQDLPRDKAKRKKEPVIKPMISATASTEKENSTEARVTQKSDTPKSSLK
jgi:hypothetical protein